MRRNRHIVRAMGALRLRTIGGVRDEPAVDPAIGGKVTAREWDGAMASLARRQHGVVARRQLLAFGMGSRAIEIRIERGRLHPLHRGVYEVGYRRISRKGRWMAAVLATGPRACLSRRSAARFWRLLPPGDEWPEMTVPPGHRVRRSGLIVRESTLAADEWEKVDGIPVTAPFRTIFDLAAVGKTREVERAWHESLVRELTAKVSLPTLLERHPRHRGTRMLRALLGSEAPVGITRNDFEEAFLVLVDAHGIRRPRMNAALALRGRFFEIDALWEAERVAVELESRSVHGTPGKFESDRLRDRVLLAEGWKTIRVTWRALQHEPEEVVADLRAALGQGHHQQPPGK
jgi:very-short-patch-repair endonuclease